jgi:TolB protein
VGDDGNIYRIRPQGGSPVQITSDAQENSESVRRYQNPTWDPSSDALAYIEVLDRSGGLDEAWVHVLPAGADESEVVYRDSDSFPIYLDWSSRGSRLAILTSRQGVSELRLWVAQGISMAVELDWGQPYYWDWSQDGERLFVHVGGSATANPANARLSLFPTIGSKPENLAQRPGSFRAPAYRPEQGGLLVALEDQQGSRLALLDERGREQSNLAEVTLTTSFSWSPDGEKVAYVEGAGLDPDSLGDLEILAVEDDEVVGRIESGLNGVAAFFWSPDGRRLAAFVPEFVEPREDQLVSYSAQAPSFIFRLIVVDANSGEWLELDQLRPTNDWLSVVAYHDQYQRSGTVWSPSGDSIVYTSARPGGAPGVFVIEAEEGAEARLIAEGTVAFWSLSSQ